MEERPELQIVMTGNSVEAAIDRALTALKKDISDVVVDVLDDGGKSRARVRVVPLDSPEKIRLLIAEVYGFLQDNGLLRDS